MMKYYLWKYFRFRYLGFYLRHADEVEHLHITRSGRDDVWLDLRHKRWLRWKHNYPPVKGVGYKGYHHYLVTYRGDYFRMDPTTVPPASNGRWTKVS